MIITGNFERFQCCNFETNSQKNENLFQKTFLVESTKIENASFLYEPALLKASVKTNKMGSTKWTYHKQWNFASNYAIF